MGALPLREAGLAHRLALQRELQFTASHARQLRCQAVLHGHEGCVNRLAWNDAGDRLISGSDDHKVIIWPYPPNSSQPPLVVETRHRAIIFGVQFLPGSNDARVISGGMDHTVQLHELPPAGLPNPLPLRAQATGGARPATLQPVHPRTTLYGCHRARVKDVEVEPMNPHNFWSSGEDGFVRQYDTRISTDSQNSFASHNVLLGVARGTSSLELKSLDICKALPHLLAVACEDSFVRVYDRRRLGLVGVHAAAPGASIGDPVLCLAPAHLQHGRPRGMTHSTYVSFSHKGDRLVTTYHGDHAYAYDVTSAGCEAARYPLDLGGRAQPPPGRAGGWRGAFHAAVPWAQPSTTIRSHLIAFTAAAHGSEEEGVYVSLGGAGGEDMGPGVVLPRLPPTVEAARRDGSRALTEERWSDAVDSFSRAIHLAPWVAVLWLRRADALLGRGWSGDALWALRDADAALALVEEQRRHSAEWQSSDNAEGPPAGSSRAETSAGEGDVMAWRPHLLRARALLALHQPQTAIGALLALDAANSGASRRDEVQQVWRRALAEKSEATDRARAASQRAAPGPAEGRPAPGSADGPGMRGGTWQDFWARAANSTDGEESDGLGEGDMRGWTDGRGGHASEDDEAASEDSGGSEDLGSSSSEEGSGGSDTQGPREGFSRYLPYAKRRKPSPDPDDTSAQGGWPASWATAEELPQHPLPGVAPGPCQALQRLPSAADGAPDASLLEALRGTGGSAASDSATHTSPLPVRRQGRGRQARGVAAAGGGSGGREQYGAQELRDFMPGGRRLLTRYVGHCNMQTDIKEVCFLGPGDQLVAAGSDDGRVLIYEADTGRLLVALEADGDVANCVQPHPWQPVLATSGIEETVTLWGVGGGRSTDLVARQRLARWSAPELAQIREDNQDRGRDREQFLRSSVFTALADRPHLLHLLMDQLARRAAGSAGPQEAERGVDSDGPQDEADPRSDVSCRVT